jgi:CelD/BcsL family acetyltransferase involved in cellulose biosynthesis
MTLMSDLKVKCATGTIPAEILEWCTATASSMSTPSYFCTGDWLSSAQRHSSDLRILSVYSNQDRMVAVLPLVLKKTFLGGTVARFLGSEFHPDPLGLICAQENLVEVAACIREYFQSDTKWDRLVLDWTTREECDAWGLNGHIQTVAPYLPLDRGLDSVLQSFGKKKRYNLRAAVRKLLDEKGAEVVCPLIPEEKVVLFEEFLALHKKRSQEKGIRSSILEQDFQDHHKQLLASSNFSRIYALRLQNTTIAVVYGFSFANTFFYYQVAHDPSFGDLSPGKVLLFKVIQNCSELGCQEINFLQGNEEYKKYWSNHERQLYSLELERSNYRAVLSRYFQVILKRLRAFKGQLRNGY